MASEHRARRRPLANPELVYDAMVRILNAPSREAQRQAMSDARRLLGVPEPAEPTAAIEFFPSAQRVVERPSLRTEWPPEDPPQRVAPPERVYDPGLSAQPCGCDPGANHRCVQHR